MHEPSLDVFHSAVLHLQDENGESKGTFPHIPHLDPFSDFHSSELADHVELLDFATLPRLPYARAIAGCVSLGCPSSPRRERREQRYISPYSPTWTRFPTFTALSSQTMSSYWTSRPLRGCPMHEPSLDVFHSAVLHLQDENGESKGTFPIFPTWTRFSTFTALSSQTMSSYWTSRPLRGCPTHEPSLDVFHSAVLHLQDENGESKD